MKLSIIVPVYNEERTIAGMIDAVQASDLGSSLGIPIEKEIIVVGSTEGTARRSPSHRPVAGSAVTPRSATCIEDANGIDRSEMRQCC